MARKIRIEYADAAYHVIARGNQVRADSADDLDWTMRLDPMGEALCEDQVAHECLPADGQPLSSTG